MDVKNWKWFYLKELFDIDTGKDLIYSELTVGAFPVIGHKAENNGITAMTCKLPTHKLYDYTQTISLADRGNFFATVQTHDFYVGTRVKALVSKFSVPIECLLFICVLINNEQYRFSYGRNCCDRIDAFQIKLPVDNNGNPNWQWIENYVKETLIPQLPAKTKSVWKKEFDKTPLSPNKLQLNTKDWQNFKVRELFDIQSTNGTTTNEMQEGSEIMYIAAKKEENGVNGYFAKFGNEEYISKGNCIVFIQIGAGSAGFTTYQPKDFIGMSGKTSCGYNEHLNQYVGLFLMTILDMERPRYSFGRSWTGERLLDTNIKLPAIKNAQGEYEPDWQWMEDYIKGLPYSGCL